MTYSRVIVCARICRSSQYQESSTSVMAVCRTSYWISVGNTSLLPQFDVIRFHGFKSRFEFLHLLSYLSAELQLELLWITQCSDKIDTASDSTDRGSDVNRTLQLLWSADRIIMILFWFIAHFWQPNASMPLLYEKSIQIPKLWWKPDIIMEQIDTIDLRCCRIQYINSEGTFVEMNWPSFSSLT